MKKIILGLFLILSVNSFAAMSEDYLPEQIPSWEMYHEIKNTVLEIAVRAQDEKYKQTLIMKAAVEEDFYMQSSLQETGEAFYLLNPELILGDKQEQIVAAIIYNQLELLEVLIDADRELQSVATVCTFCD